MHYRIDDDPKGNIAMTETTTPTNLNGLDVYELDKTLFAVAKQPELAQVQFALESEWLDGCHQRAVTGPCKQNGEVVENRTARYTLESDEPAALLGTDKSTSPAEYILQALAGCYAVTFPKNATVRNIHLTSLSFDLETDFDLQGFLGLADDVKPGTQEIRIAVTAEASNATAEELEELTRSVEGQSPIRDTLANPVTVSTTLVTE